MSRTKYPIHPDFKMWAHVNAPIIKPLLPLIQALMKPLYSMQRSTDKLSVAKKSIPTRDGATLRALWYVPVGLQDPAPCLIVYHGGGFVMPAAPYHFSLAREYALGARCRLLFVDYRLAPKHPFPTAPEDCFAAYEWVLQNAAALGVDPSHIAVTGDSAGGELAAVVCLMARDRGLPTPCGQMLVYPVVGGDQDTESMRSFTDTPMCNSRDIAKYHKLYMQDPSAGKPEYGAPLTAGTLAGMPPAYIETAEFDCLHDGGVLYAERLREYGIPAQLNNTKGTMHGFDIVLKSPIVRECVKRRIAFLCEIFTQAKAR